MVSIPLRILYVPIVIILPILLAYYLFSPTVADVHPTNGFQILKISVSNVLAESLQLVRSTREHAILTFALLELQNPELTVFAGAGYGVRLRHPNPGAVIEAFPNGKLPQAGGSRYDPWTMVKGLRYAATFIVTNGSAGPEVAPLEHEKGNAQSRIRDRTGSVSEERGKAKKGGWLAYHRGETSAVDAAGFGWAALLLERAGAIDVDNPVGPGKNAYREAADGMIDWLYDEAKNARYMIDEQTSKIRGGVEQVAQRTQETRWTISYIYDTPQVRAETVFMVAPFLSAYAVARQDDYWLLEAVEQIRMHREILAYPSGDQKELWKHDAEGQLQPDVDPLDTLHALANSAWTLGGTVKVLAVMERWQRRTSAAIEAELLQGRKELLEFTQQILSHFRTLSKNLCTDLPIVAPNQDMSNSTKSCTSRHIGSTALLASSIYRLAQLNLLEDQSMLMLADDLYNGVAKQITVQTRPVTISASREHSLTAFDYQRQSESQSMILMMYAARRDCVELKMCRPTLAKDWRGWPLSAFM